MYEDTSIAFWHLTIFLWLIFAFRIRPDTLCGHSCVDKALIMETPPKQIRFCLPLWQFCYCVPLHPSLHPANDEHTRSDEHKVRRSGTHLAAQPVNLCSLAAGGQWLCLVLLLVLIRGVTEDQREISLSLI